MSPFRFRTSPCRTCGLLPLDVAVQELGGILAARHYTLGATGSTTWRGPRQRQWWFDRLWAHPGVRVGPGGSEPTASPGQVFADLSELIHGARTVDAARLAERRRYLRSAVVDGRARVGNDHGRADDQPEPDPRRALATVADDKSWDVLRRPYRR